MPDDFPLFVGFAGMWLGGFIIGFGGVRWSIWFHRRYAAEPSVAGVLRGSEAEVSVVRRICLGAVVGLLGGLLGPPVVGTILAVCTGDILHLLAIGEFALLTVPAGMFLGAIIGSIAGPAHNAGKEGQQPR
jgi:hypothetical protein